VGMNGKKVEDLVDFKWYLIRWHFCVNLLHLLGEYQVF
jgi:hypothetical protein